MKPHIGISDKHLEGVTNLLTGILANEMVLYVKTRKFHWNVNGESFMEFHKLFESQYKQLEETIDEVAERVNKLGSPAIGTMKEFSEKATIKEAPGKYPDRMEMVKELLDDNETVIKELRKAIDDCSDKYKDAGTADFLTKIMEDHESVAWILRRYLK
jgi:starvation-inducible DNA-binding protein